MIGGVCWESLGVSMLIIRIRVDLSRCLWLRDQGGKMPACQEEQGLGVLSLLPGYIVGYIVTAGRAGWKVLYKGEQGLFRAAERKEAADGVTVWVGTAAQTVACSWLNLEHMFRGGLRAATLLLHCRVHFFPAKGRIQLRNINSLS